MKLGQTSSQVGWCCGRLHIIISKRRDYQILELMRPAGWLRVAGRLQLELLRWWACNNHAIWNYLFEPLPFLFVADSYMDLAATHSLPLIKSKSKQVIWTRTVSLRNLKRDSSWIISTGYHVGISSPWHASQSPAYICHFYIRYGFEAAILKLVYKSNRW